MNYQQSTASTTSLERLQELLPQLFQSTQLPGQPFLRFQIAEGVMGLVPMDVVQESLIVPAEQITSLPNMPGPVMGLMNSRERVFCVANLPQIIGYTQAANALRRYFMIVVSLAGTGNQNMAGNDSLLGLVVPNIQGIVRLERGHFQTNADLIPMQLKPYATAVSQQEGLSSYLLSPHSLAQSEILSISFV